MPEEIDSLEAMEDEALIEAFEALTIDPLRFDHTAHVRLGWAYLNVCPTFEAIERFNTGLKAFTVSLGQRKKYHETISWFYLLIINERMARCSASDGPDDWYAFKAANPDLLNHKRGLVFDYYSKETITSDLARQHFVLPSPRQSPPLPFHP